MVLTTKAPDGTSPWSVPPAATFPVGFQLIGQNGLRVPASIWKEDLFLSAMAVEASSPCLGLASADAGRSVAFVPGAADAVFCPAASKLFATKIENATR